MSLEIIKNELLSRHTSFAIGGPARLFARAHSREDLLESVAYIRKEGMPYYILGGGSNVLVGDKGFDGIVIKNEDRSYSIDDTKVIAAPGVVLAMLVHKTAGMGLSGLEWAFGVPGTVGGAVRGNAGAFGTETKDVIESVEVVDIRSGEIYMLTPQDLAFTYRRSACLDHPEWMILQVIYRLSHDDPSRTMQRLHEYHARKKATQPLGAHCAGSMFKNNPIALFRDTSLIPEEYIKKERVPSGYLIERVGLKGYQLGRVKISEIHANFFINTGGATCEDVLQLVNLAKRKVFEEFGIHLAEEIQYIGF